MAYIEKKSKKREKTERIKEKEKGPNSSVFGTRRPWSVVREIFDIRHT